MNRFGAALAAMFALLSFAATPAKAVDPALSYPANATYLKENAAKPGVVVRPSGLQYNVIKDGSGEHPGRRDIVTVNYRGTLINGQVFDGTQPGKPANFPVNKLIPGWTEALLLMRPGDVWHVVIPANLAYGSQGVGNGLIPPGQVLGSTWSFCPLPRLLEAGPTNRRKRPVNPLGHSRASVHLSRPPVSGISCAVR